MKVAFDLDDTLIETTKSFSCGVESPGYPQRLFFREKLRKGAKKLLRQVSANHDIWIYTTSLRSPFYLKSWFYFLGIRLDGIVNQMTHNREAAKHPDYSKFSKAPGYYGIALMIDDSKGVAIECEQQGCRVCIIDPNDLNWTSRVTEFVGL